MVNNTKYGSDALQNNTGINNTAIGAYTAYHNLDASNNTAIGSNSSFFNQSGSNNTALGAGSLCNNVNGSLNTAIGSSALEGLSNQSAGDQNVAIGAQALYVNGGSLNTAIGTYAGEMVDGSYNTFLGANTSFSNVSNSYQYSTAIGYGAEITDTNQIMMGGTGAGSYPNIVMPGQVGIGKSPEYDIYYTSQDLFGSINGSDGQTGYLSTFPDSKMVIYGTADTISYTKIFYIQNISNPLTYISVNLSDLITGADNYSSDLSKIYIAQIYPVYYSSNTNCKFFIRLEIASANNNLYIITCDGDPTQITSYSYSTNYLKTGGNAPNLISNGVSCLSGGSIPTISNGAYCGRQRMTIDMYDKINNLLILCSHASTSPHCYTVLNTSLTQCAQYNYSIPNGFTNTALHFDTSTYDSNCSVRLYNNYSNTSYPYIGQLQICYWNPTNYSINISPYFDVTNVLENGNYQNNSISTPYIIVEDDLIYVYMPWYSGISTYTSNIAVFNWNKNILNQPTFMFTKFIENIGTNISNNNDNQYIGLIAYDTNNIELFSSYSNNYYITNTGFLNIISYPVSGYSSGYSTFLGGGFYAGQGTWGDGTKLNFPFISILRGTSLTNFNNRTLFNSSPFSLDISGNAQFSGQITASGGISVSPNFKLLRASIIFVMTSSTTFNIIQNMNIDSSVNLVNEDGSPDYYSITINEPSFSSLSLSQFNLSGSGFVDWNPYQAIDWTNNDPMAVYLVGKSVNTIQIYAKSLGGSGGLQTNGYLDIQIYW